MQQLVNQALLVGHDRRADEHEHDGHDEVRQERDAERPELSVSSPPPPLKHSQLGVKFRHGVRCGELDCACAQPLDVVIYSDEDAECDEKFDDVK
jgi:hypothetical protein